MNDGGAGSRPTGGAGSTSAGERFLSCAEAIWQAVSPLLPGLTVEVLPEVDSTNSELMRRSRAGRLEPVLLVAERQTAGRGRLGRAWQSAGGESLTFSLGVPLAPADWSGLSLAVGVSLAESLHPAIGLKWPNDLWLTDRKLAGILIETAVGIGVGGLARYAVVGVGINIGQGNGDGLAIPAACLREVLPGAEPAATLLRVAEPLVRSLQLFESAGYAAFQARFHARDVLHERAVVLSDGTTGIARGTSASGALMVHTAGAVKMVISSEVSVRPAA